MQAIYEEFDEEELFGGEAQRVKDSAESSDSDCDAAPFSKGDEAGRLDAGAAPAHPDGCL